MASNYPTSLDAFSTTHSTGQVIAASTDNDHSDAINKIEAELGTNPSGAASTVTARLAAAEGVFVSDSPTLGIVLKDVQAHYWRVTILTTGALTTTDLGTTKPSS